MSEKAILWVGTSLRDLRSFPEDARGHAGFQLRRLQLGMMPTDWKPMPSVGVGVQELRIHTDLEHRILYLVRLKEGIYVLHAFEKRSRKTTDSDLAIARKRLAEVLAQRAGREST